MVRRQQAGDNQGTDQGNAGQGVAADVADPRRRGDPVRLLGRHLGKTVDPGGVDPVGGAGVHHLYGRVLDQTDGLAGRVVGQAEDGKIGRIQGLGPRRRVLAPRLVQAQQLDVAPLRQAVADLQARRPRLAVDEDLRHHGRSLTGTVMSQAEHQS